MSTQFFFPRLPTSAPYRSFRLKDPNFNTVQKRRERQPTTPDPQMLSSTLLCTSMTLHQPVTSFRARNCRCVSVSSPTKPPKHPKRPSNLSIAQNQTTSFGRKSTYVSPLPSPADDAPQSAPPLRSIPSPLSISDSLSPSPITTNVKEYEERIESPSSRALNNVSPPTSSFGSAVTSPTLLSEEESKSVESPTSPCKSILRRSTGEMQERSVTAPGYSGRMEAPDSISLSQSLSAMSRKGVRFDVEKNSLHTYERDSGDGFIVNGVKKIRIARHLFHKDE